MFVKLDKDGPEKKKPEFSGKPELTAEQIQILKQRCEHEDVEFYYRATPSLQQYIARGHVITDQLPELIKVALLEGKGIAVTRDMIYNWLSGTLDKRNSFILDHAEIRIENDPMQVVRRHHE